eukprot:1938964-Prymnesium_polylepis.1
MRAYRTHRAQQRAAHRAARRDPLWDRRRQRASTTAAICCRSAPPFRSHRRSPVTSAVLLAVPVAGPAH